MLRESEIGITQCVEQIGPGNAVARERALQCEREWQTAALLRDQTRVWRQILDCQTDPVCELYQRSG